jgi:hypothetical protein
VGPDAPHPTGLGGTRELRGCDKTKGNFSSIFGVKSKEAKSEGEVVY